MSCDKILNRFISICQKNCMKFALRNFNMTYNVDKLEVIMMGVQDFWQCEMLQNTCSIKVAILSVGLVINVMYVYNILG